LNLKTAIEGARDARAHLMQSGRLQMVGRMASALAGELSVSARQVARELEKLLETLQAQQRLIDALGDRVLEGGPADDPTRRALEAELSQRGRTSAHAAIERAASIASTGLEDIADRCEGITDFAGQTTQRTSVDLNRAIENTMRVADPAWRPHATLTWDLQPDLPNVECVDGQLKQSILGLVLNAIEAVQGLFGEGPRSGRIAIGTRAVDAGVEIRISDNGPGVPVALREQIFEPFFSTKQAGTCSGLGLSFAHDVIVHAHGGRIQCEKSSLGGACFRIWLPLRQRGARDASCVASGAGTSAPPRASAGRRLTAGSSNT
jgi:signal transduction histidine kinase